MKFKLLPILLSVIAFTMTVTPLAVKAETPLSQQSSAQVKQLKQKLLTGVELTDEQKDKLLQIRDDTRSQIENLLTDEQKDQFKVARQNGERMRSAITSVNLSQEQKTELRNILKSSRDRVKAVLTPEQWEQVQQNRGSRRSNQEDFSGAEEL